MYVAFKRLYRNGKKTMKTAQSQQLRIPKREIMFQIENNVNYSPAKKYLISFCYTVPIRTGITLQNICISYNHHVN